MAYVDPNTVLSPKQSWTLKKVIFNSGDDGWSAAEGLWEKKERLALRWNGSATDNGVGSPQSRGFPTWFIVPDELADALRLSIKEALRADENAGVAVTVFRPDGYERGAWRIDVKVAGCRDEDGPFIFDIPMLPNRYCHPDREYVRAVESELKGQLKKGSWFADVYSNGVSEDENPTTMQAFQDALVRSISKSLHRS